MSNEIDPSLKFVWAYMLESGYVTTGEWNYYHGRYDSKNPDNRWKYLPAMEELDTELKTIGIDWEKTKPPKSSTQKEFTDTYHDASKIETLLGTLVFKDGTEHIVGTNDAETRFHDYVSHLNSLMADKQRVKDILGEE